MSVRFRFVLLAASASGALGLAAGMQFAPTPDVQVREVEHVVYRDRVVTVTERQAEQVRNVVVYRDRVTKPDGTVTEREVERLHEVATEHVRTQQEATSESTRDAERSATFTTPAPKWHVAALVGAPALWPPGPPLVGLHLQRRLFGPVTAGAWTLVPTGPGAPASVGVSLGVEW